MNFKLWLESMSPLETARRVAETYRKMKESLWRQDRVDARLPPKERLCAGGCCDCAAEDVAERMIQAGIPGQSVRIVRGEFRRHDHWWTELDGSIIIDTTVDQFGDHLPRVLVGTYDDYPDYRPIQRQQVPH